MKIGMKTPIVLLALAASAATLAAFAAHPLSKPLSIQSAGKLTSKEIPAPDDPAWKKVDARRLHLNRTPPLYVDGPYDDGERPVAEVRLLKLEGGSVAVRLDWTDATLNRAPGARRYPGAGAGRIYKKHSENIETFGDAACLMIPVKGGRRSVFPSIMMGDKADPVFLYFWRAGAGARLLKATGRETPRATGEAISVRAERTAKGWSVAFLVKDLPSGTPIAFAIWDGAKGHRDGVKYYSAWYEVE